MKPTLTAVIIARNEADMIANCIETVKWCDQILLIDNGSTDNTAEIAEKLGARTVFFASKSFAQLRNKALKYIKTDWIFYIDADERVTPQLSQEILVHLETDSSSALQLKRANVLYGYTQNHGGWDQDFVTRIFKAEEFKGWQGEIHESPELHSTPVQLHTPLIHLTHRSTVDNLQKSAQWTPIEAELLYKSGVPPVTVWTLLRKGMLETFRRAILKKGYQDGTPGWIEAIVQGLNRIMVYIQVWELQQKPPLPERYQDIEAEIVELWKKK